jgi:uncharacterized protein YydD (DUF2326 family)
MRFRKLSANQPGFHTVTFRDGLNVVVAERTKESTKKDTRNGLGKSTFIEIVHFCLGRALKKGQVPLVDDLADWSFTLDVELDGKDVRLTRSVSDPKVIQVAGDFDAWPVEPAWDEETQRFLVSHAQLRDVLAWDFFELRDVDGSKKYRPTLGSCLGYFSRRGPDAYVTPFEHHRKQMEWDKQVNVADLLDLNWQDASAFQELKDEKKGVDALARAAKDGVLTDYLGSEGALETERVQLEEELRRQVEHLQRFEVREDYRDIEGRANELTERLHQLANENYSDRRTLELYRTAVTETDASEQTSDVQSVFEEAGLVFPERVVRRLDEVAAFHERVVTNRREYLAVEIARVEGEIRSREALIAQADAERAAAMRVLQTQGALEEFEQLQRRVNETRQALTEVEKRIARLRELAEAKSKHADRVRQLEAQAHQRYEELREQREMAIRLFNANTQALYETSGRLIIDITATGFRFDVEIERARSAGVSKMKIFCFDLTLAQIWAEHDRAPSFLLHDSLLYDGVDERQKALALDRAAREADRLGWQYICTFNSDELPDDQLPDDSPARVEPILTLTDAHDEGMLLGRRFG